MRKPNVRHSQSSTAELAQQLADFDAVFTDTPTRTPFKGGDIVRAIVRTEAPPLFLLVTEDSNHDLFQGVVLINLSNESGLKPGQLHTWSTRNYSLSSWEEILQIAAILNAPDK